MKLKITHLLDLMLCALVGAGQDADEIVLNERRLSGLDEGDWAKPGHGGDPYRI